MKDENRKYISTADAADMLSVSDKTLERLRCTGNGPEYCKIGSRVIYPVDKLHSWVQSQTHSSTSAYNQGRS